MKANLYSLKFSIAPIHKVMGLKAFLNWVGFARRIRIRVSSGYFE